MRTLAIFLAGLVLGIVLTFSGVNLTGGWYTYFTIPEDECRYTRVAAEVTPGQPNPCNYRRPRWQLVR